MKFPFEVNQTDTAYAEWHFIETCIRAGVCFGDRFRNRSGRSILRERWGDSVGRMHRPDSSIEITS
ncbi:MAG: hypothetical protein P1U77_11440 [Rubripirellula sp.]|nr:hypothetical protein [Planctomycetaceae bacterium]MDF1842042.1 hypothetical protein [Rubripirellula sp.]